jgi:serine phosphatase RsbU (regulator of sigma subunit)
MKGTLLTIAKRFQPELETHNEMEQIASKADVIGFLYSAPVAVVGLAWLITATDLSLLASEWLILTILFILVLLFKRLSFFVHLDFRGARFVSVRGSLSNTIAWAGALLLGPSALWLAVLGPWGEFLGGWRRASLAEARWRRLRSLSLRGASTVPTGLLALTLYERWGGGFPLPGLTVDAVVPALCATAVQFSLAALIYAPFTLYLETRAVQPAGGATTLRSLVQAATVGLVLPALLAPFGVLATGLYSQNGLGIFLLFVGGLLVGSLSSHRLSQAVKHSLQRSRELESLEQLGHAIIGAPPDASSLPELLQQHVPGMFPSSHIEIRRFPDQTLVRFPDSDKWPAVPAPVWDWIRTNAQACCFSANEAQLWNHPSQGPLVVAPVLDTENGKPIGGVVLAPSRDTHDVASLLPAVESLTARISSALHSAQVYRQTLEHQKVEQELALAGQIQARFLPDTLPQVPGWQLAVTLEPARQTSGDFYDVIPLPNGRLGILVADVADKGTGAALYMALSRTLIRTYAVEHHARPDFALRVANNRILTDTQVDMFVTVFYGVLDPLTGKLTYCNAGHNPPLLLSKYNGTVVRKLTRTGIPLGIFTGQTWEQRTVQLDMGDVLVLYTDGVTEAQNHQAAFFGEQRLMAVAQAHKQSSAQEIRAAVMREIQTFVGRAPQFDDIALLVLVREA